MESYLAEVNDNWVSFTVITGLRVKQTKVEIPSLILVFLNSLNFANEPVFPNKSNLVEWIKLYANQKVDHFIFIGSDTEIETIWNHSTLNKIKWKWGYSSSFRIFTSIQSVGKPLKPTIFSDITTLERSYKPEVFAMGHNLRGRRFRCTAWTKASPYFLVSKVHANGDMEFDGTMFRVLNETFEKFNFTNDIIPNDENTYAEHLPNGTWTGIVGDLLYEEKQFDISIHLGPQVIWYDLFDFSNSLTSLKILFVAVQPMPEVQWQAFLRPFDLTVWISLLLSCIIMTVCMFILSSCLEINAFSSLGTSQWNLGSILYVSIITPYKIALEESTKIIPGTKILSTVWLFAVLITGAAYRTQIISALTFPISQKLPKTNHDLVARPDYKIVVNNIGEVESALFQTSESPVIQQLAKRAVYETSQYECIRSIILQPKTVCFSWCPMLLLVAAEKAIVDLQVDPFVLSYDAVASSELSVAFPKNSPYITGFSYIIDSIYESGLYNLWNDDIYSKQRKKGLAMYKNSTGSKMHRKLKSITDELKGASGMRPLKITHLKMMFCVELVGLIFASLAFFFEYGGVVVQTELWKLTDNISQSIWKSFKKQIWGFKKQFHCIRHRSQDNANIHIIHDGPDAYNMMNLSFHYSNIYNSRRNNNLVTLQEI